LENGFCLERKTKGKPKEGKILDEGELFPQTNMLDKVYHPVGYASFRFSARFDFNGRHDKLYDRQNNGNAAS
jgi:hypothetical protein